MRMESNREVDIGSLVERALDGLEQSARDAAREPARVDELDLARMEAAFELGECHLRQMPGAGRG
jgi:hypothetical protein